MSESTNLFALLGGDDGDDIQQLAAKAAPLIKQEAAAPAPAKAAAPAKPDAPGRGDGAGRGGRGGRGEGRGGRGGRGPRAPRGDQPNGVVAEDAGEEGRGDGGRGRARVEGGRGRGRGPAGARAPRREYERRDGTGRAHEPIKRGGAGAHNWGTETEEGAKPEAETQPEAAPVAEYVVEGGAEAEEGAAPAAEAAAAPEPEPEKPELTLEEYEKQLAEKRAALNKVAEVKAVSLDEFKGMKTYVRKEVEEAIPGLEISKRKEPKAKEADNKENKPKKQIAVLETGFQIKDSNADAPRGGRGAGRGGRGARGEGRGDRPQSGRGGRGGGEGRGPRPAAQGPRSTVQLAINDDQAFPSLG